MTKELLFLEFNEVNFENVLHYCREGRLPNLHSLVRRNGWAQTVSEHRYEELEPWIQWVTAHTGLPLAEHRVFRLGDIVQHDYPQIWEQLEERGLRVGAISPMNAKHRLRDAAFFVPDPWTRTSVTAPGILRRLYSAITQAVNDNAQARVSLSSLVNLAIGFLRYVAPRDYGRYLGLAASSRAHPWRKAMILDELLAEVFIHEVARTRPHFASLFLNAAAHIQHHYLFSAGCYAGPHRNPAWYVPQGRDPVLEVYEAYDRILGRVRRRFSDARIMVATGLHQDPHAGVTYYWRLRNHRRFLKSIGVRFERLEPRMSRDFLVVCASPPDAAEAAARLAMARAPDGVPLFDVDNRGRDLFVMLTYPGPIDEDFTVHLGNESYAHFSREVAFVALKNGEHNGIGYFLDSETRFHDRDRFPLATLPERIKAALLGDLSPSQPLRAQAS